MPKLAAVNTPSAPMVQMLPYALVEAASKVIFLRKFEKFYDSYFSTFNIKVTARHVRISMSVRPMVLFVILLQIHRIVSTVLEATRVQHMSDLQI